MRSRLARVVAVLAALLLCAEASGFAQAMGNANIRCCCGVHERESPCDCPDCPVRHAAHDGSRPRAKTGGARIGACHGQAPDLARGSLPSVVAAIVPTLSPPLRQSLSIRVSIDPDSAPPPAVPHPPP